MCIASSLRSLMKSPDATINRRSNHKPYDYLLNEDGSANQYKYFSKQDFSKIRVDADRPKLD